MYKINGEAFPMVEDLKPEYKETLTNGRNTLFMTLKGLYEYFDSVKSDEEKAEYEKEESEYDLIL